jgi:hypothetical protein
MLTCFITISFHHKALHVVIELSLVEYDMFSCLLLCILHLHYLAAAQMDALRISMKSSMSSRRSFPSQLPMEDFCVCFFSVVSYLNVCLVETFGHVIIV